MNLRILKKLSKRAAELLPLAGCDLGQFLSEKNDSYISTSGHDRKHWSRSRSIHAKPWGRDIVFKPRHGKHFLVLRQPDHPLKGTVMVGLMSGYYEPEWEEHDAWDTLRTIVADHFSEYEGYNDDQMNWPRITRRLPNPSAIFHAVPEVVACRHRLAACAGARSISARHF